jgi:hypothetical protein
LLKVSDTFEGETSHEMKKWWHDEDGNRPLWYTVVHGTSELSCIRPPYIQYSSQLLHWNRKKWF